MTEPSSTPGTVVVAVPVRDGRRLGHSWGKAPRVAIATVRDGGLVAWEEHDVRWDLAHGQGPHGSHHARVVRFLREHGVGAVAADHMGEPMVHTLGKLGVVVVLGAADDGEAAALAAASRVVPSA
jgi:predicted Fe-Mo cluster-binding NifX family protein